MSSAALRSVETGEVRDKLAFQDMAGLGAQSVCDRIGMLNIIYSFGLMHPGAITLHNYPRALQRFERPDGVVIDLAAHDILRIRESGVLRYTGFREFFDMKPVGTFQELTDNPAWREEMRRVYNNRIDKVDLIVGLFAENPPKGFRFSETAFLVFALRGIQNAFAPWRPIKQAA